MRTAEQNYIFNKKKQIPANKQIAFIDGNSDNTAFKNLKLVDKTPEDIKPVKEVKGVKKEKKVKKTK
jgi:hypothetical protein